MCDLCDQWKKGQIAAKEVMIQIGERLKGAKQKDINHLISLSSKILDDEVPLADTDSAADERWWNHHHPEPKSE